MILHKLLSALSVATDSPLTTADVFSSAVYTGDGYSAHAISNGINLSENGGLVWIKQRNASQSNIFTDSARGVTSQVFSESSSAAYSYTNSVVSFDSSGFTLGTSAYSNQLGSTFASWSFRKAPKFFDVLSWTGNSVFGRAIPHSLGVKPGMMVVKMINASKDWFVWHRSLANETSSYLVLNSATTVGSYNLWNTAPDANNIYLGGSSDVNSSGNTYIGYLFADDVSTGVLTKCGSYVGNGSSQTIDCGFSTGAKFILIKSVSTTGNWYVWDTTRGIVAGYDPHLIANTTSAEVTVRDSVDPDNSGFVVNQINFQTTINESGATYIYFAIG